MSLYMAELEQRNLYDNPCSAELSLLGKFDHLPFAWKDFLSYHSGVDSIQPKTGYDEKKS
jgi:hypothetical protein